MQSALVVITIAAYSDIKLNPMPTTRLPTSIASSPSPPAPPYRLSISNNSTVIAYVSYGNYKPLSGMQIQLNETRSKRAQRRESVASQIHTLSDII